MRWKYSTLFYGAKKAIPTNLDPWGNWTTRSFMDLLEAVSTLRRAGKRDSDLQVKRYVKVLRYLTLRANRSKVS